MKTIIVIVTHNAMEWLPKCLEATKPFPVIIVDNNSTDRTVVYIKKNFPEVKLFEQQANLGFGQANNFGIRIALEENADYVFLLNQDAYLQEDCVNQLILLHKKNAEYGVLSPIHLNGSGNLLDENFSLYLNYEANKYFYSDFVIGNHIKEIYEVPFVNAAGWLLSRSCLETVGGFDPIFYHYGEDENYCQRVLFHNFKIGVVPTAFMRHDREMRKQYSITKGSKEYLEQLGRTFKIKYANINFGDIEDVQRILKTKNRQRLKFLLMLKFKKAEIYTREIKMILEILEQIYVSRKRNVKKGLHYLEM